MIVIPRPLIDIKGKLQTYWFVFTKESSSYVQSMQYLCRLKRYVKERYFTYLKINRFSIVYVLSLFVQRFYNLISIESSALGPAIMTLLLAVMSVC